jgi:hypothetical protein
MKVLRKKEVKEKAKRISPKLESYAGRKEKGPCFPQTCIKSID